MSAAFFYNQQITTDSTQVVLNEDTSKHVIQVLRMQMGDQLKLTDGCGNIFSALIIDDHKKRCTVSIHSKTFQQVAENKITIGISLVKNTSRFEWFLEKATEIGVTAIIPIICDRTEKQHVRFDRMKTILVSAMLQSQQCWLPLLQEPVQFGNLVISPFDNYKKLIAHCLPDGNKETIQQQISKFPNQLILIGPEGDFTKPEIELALQNNFIPVSLGNTRLRTETAGIVAAVLLCNI
ncbi:16S rRNA (uracil(1498)-N(3))-methyltransferase [soil metagenome]